MNVFIPENLNLEELLEKHPPDFRFHPDNFKYIIGTLLRIHASYRDYQDMPYVPLNSTLLQAFIHSYKAHIQHLIDIGVLETDNQYIVGTKSKGYRLTEKYATQNSAIEEIEKKSVLKRVKAIDEVNTINLGSYHFLSKWFDDNLSVDVDAALKMLEDLYAEEKRMNVEAPLRKYQARKMSMEMINHRMYFTKVDTTVNRFHSNLTNLKSELRNYITYAGKQLCSVDVKNSQPFISTILLQPSFYEKNDRFSVFNLNPSIYNYIKSSIPSIINILNNSSYIMLVKKGIEDCDNDVELYCTLVDKGSLYGYLAEKYDEKYLTHTDVSKPQDKRFIKEGLFTTLFSDNRFIHQPGSEIKQLFADAFPTVYAVFKAIKKGKKQVLAIILQQIEAEIMINRVAKKLDDQYGFPIFTIHDSIVSLTVNKNQVRSVLKQEFEKALGLRPSLSEDIWKPK